MIQRTATGGYSRASLRRTPTDSMRGMRLITRRHVDHCRTASAVCPSVRR
ncbi:hypothetical protein [Streptomyces soliscabiei]|nr:hypothetical protein [Streptomyces sp. NY05-11A]MDX2682805.1 hypothetical protein [Streptomyces sp. NY05-11A]